MSVFRVHKTKDFTVMSNHHLRNKDLSLKAKGLLSTMLSLPEDWDYSAEGLATLSSDGLSSIKSGLQELEEHKYLIRSQATAPNGKFAGYDYDIYEFPYAENPNAEKPSAENPSTENQLQLNTDIISSDTISSRTISTPTSTIPTKKKDKVLNNKENSIKEKGLSFEKKFDLSFVSVSFDEIFRKWLTYKQDRKEMYKTQMTVEENYRKLLKMAGNDPWTAQQIVDETIAGGWMGYVMPKNLTGNGSSNQTKQQYAAGRYSNPYVEAGITAEGLF